jgi:hypothetical protein
MPTAAAYTMWWDRLLLTKCYGLPFGLPYPQFAGVHRQVS